MDRRTLLSGSLGMAAALALPRWTRAAQAPASSPTTGGLPTLEITLTDTGFDFPQPLAAGRYGVVVANAGASAESHFGLGRIPAAVTDAEYEEWLAAEGDTAALSFEQIEFVGVPDWPAPGGTVTGAIDLAAGRYLIFDPFEARGFQTLRIDEAAAAATTEPDADVTVTMREMAFDLPDAALTSESRRWKIVNAGAMIHEVAVIPVSPEFTEEHLRILFALPEDATPPAGVPAFDYLPVAAIGLLAAGGTSWLDVELAPGRYLAACMAPFGTGYPHAMDGMYRLVDVG